MDTDFVARHCHRRLVVTSLFIRVHLVPFEMFSGHHLGRYGDAFEFIGGLTMKQGKNIVKQVRSKDVLFRPVPSA
jgi:hypothetical protein